MPLIFQSTAVARPAYYDRNPVTSLLAFGPINAGPHGATNRVVLTVPTGKKAYLDSAWVQAWRTSAAATNGPASLSVVVGLSGGPFTNLYYHPLLNNVVNDLFEVIIPQVAFLNAADQVLLQTADPSTGGAVTYSEGCKVTTFDA